MYCRRTLASIGLASGLFLALSASAQAFTFKTNLASGSNPPQGDIKLESVTLEDNTIISDFALVNSAKILQNDVWVGGNSGAASSDLGDFATVGTKVENPTDADIVTSLGNTYLSSIIDTEDQDLEGRGSFTINLAFDQLLDRIFLWERGGRNRLGIQALDASGNLIGNLVTVFSGGAGWSKAGFSLNTREIPGAQEVFSTGLTLADLGVNSPISGIQVTSRRDFGGPDFKILGGRAGRAVPEPSAMLALGLLGGTMMLVRRRQTA